MGRSAVVVNTEQNAGLSIAQGRLFYDRFGAWQDKSAFYEDPAITQMLEHAAMATANTVVEFGCGTGRIALRLLRRELPRTAIYWGIDASPTMVRLASSRLHSLGGRASVCLTDGTLSLPLADSCCDRFISTYVLDLLSPSDIALVVQEANRILVPGGKLCLVSLTHGATPVGRMAERLWTAVFRHNPWYVGGCRPISIDRYLSASTWIVEHRNSVIAWGLTSEALVAVKLD